MSTVRQEFEWLSVPAAAKVLGVSTFTIRRLVREGRLPYYRIPGFRRPLFRLEDLIAFPERVPARGEAEGE